MEDVEFNSDCAGDDKPLNKSEMSSLEEEDKQALLNRLNRIEGQVRGIKKMIRNEKYCIDILTQITATRGALKNAGLKVLNRHIDGCVSDAIEKGESKEVVPELIDIVNRFMD